MTSHQHLRIWYLDDSAKEIARAPLSSALLPLCRVPATGELPKSYLGASPFARRDLAARILLNEKRRPKPAFVAVAVTNCPDRHHLLTRRRRARSAHGDGAPLTARNAYVGSLCVLARGTVVVDDFCAPTFKTAQRVVLEKVRAILARATRGRPLARLSRD